MGYVTILLSVSSESKAPVYGWEEIFSTHECKSSPNLPFGQKIQGVFLIKIGVSVPKRKFPLEDD